MGLGHTLNAEPAVWAREMHRASLFGPGSHSLFFLRLRGTSAGTGGGERKGRTSVKIRAAARIKQVDGRN